MADQGESQSKCMSDDLDLINQQLEQLVEDISPALNGDLRVQSHIVEDTYNESVAMIADLSNALVEKLVQFARWTLYASDKVISTSRNVLDHSTELAQKADAQMLHLSEMTAGAEKLVAFVQRMGSALQLSVDMAQETYTHLQEKKTAVNSPQSDKLLEQLITNTQRQIQLLEDILALTQHTTTVAESVIGGLYTFEQQFHQSSTTVIETAENANSIITIAEGWRNAVEKVPLPEDEQSVGQFPDFPLEIGRSSYDSRSAEGSLK